MGIEKLVFFDFLPEISADAGGVALPV